MTQLGLGPVSDEIYEAAREHLDEKEFAAVMMAIVTINAWNRIAITSQKALD